MKAKEIQKQLTDFNRFKDRYTKVDIQVIDSKGKQTTLEDVDTGWIKVLADNPWQMNITVKGLNEQGTIYHLSENAKMTQYFAPILPNGNVTFKDETHQISFIFYQRDLKGQGSIRVRRNEVPR